MENSINIEDLPKGQQKYIKEYQRILHGLADIQINIDSAKNVNTVAVDAGGSLNQPVVRDIAFSNIDFASPNRQLLEYEIEEYFDPGTGATAPTWVHQQTTQY